MGGKHIVGLKSDGTVVAAGDNSDHQCDVSEWTDITAIDAGWNHTVGLKSDGTVVAVGDDDDGQLKVSRWSNIVAIEAGDDFTLGLYPDGSVAFTGNDSCNVDDAGSWSNVRQLTSNLANVYAQAQQYLDSGDYHIAISEFERLGPYSDSQEKAQLARNRLLRTAQQRETVYFGTNGSHPLKWQVVERSGDTLTLFCSQILTANYMQKRSAKSAVSTWNSSILYATSQNMLSNWFTDGEQAMIQATVNGKIYPPSSAELEKLYGFSIVSGDTHAELETSYYFDYSSSSSTSDWWIRDYVARINGTSYAFMFVSGKNGNISTKKTTEIGGLRPVITINVSNLAT